MLKVAAFTCIVALAAGLPAVPAAADGYPAVSGELVFEVENDWTYHSEDPDAELNDLGATFEADLFLHFAETLYLNAHLVFEEVEEPGPSEDQTFEGHGAYADVLTLNYEDDSIHVYAGKFGAPFALAYDVAPGMFGADFAEDLELAEMLGFGGSYTLDARRLGMLMLSASAFFADTTVLSESALENRGRTRHADGGPANTEAPESMTLALDLTDIPSLPGLHFHTSTALLAVDRAFDANDVQVPDSDEARFAAALEWRFEFGEDWALTPLLEYARVWNAGGIDGDHADYLTGAAAVEYQSWTMALVGSQRQIRAATGDFSDWLFQSSLGYAFDFGLEVELAWKTEHVEGIDSQTLGLFAGYAIEF